jgi:hypothetical protein
MHAEQSSLSVAIGQTNGGICAPLLAFCGGAWELGGRRFLVALLSLHLPIGRERRVGVQHQQAREDHMLDEMVSVLCFPFHFVRTSIT